VSDHLIDDLRDPDFHLHPAHFLIGVVDAPREAEDALEDLIRRGVPRHEIHTWFGPAGVAAIDPDGRRHGWGARIWRAAQRATGEHHTFERYAEEIGQGHVCVGVHCRTAHDARSAGAILGRHGGHYVNYFGAIMIETLKR
jgi:hypothetical protein